MVIALTVSEMPSALAQVDIQPRRFPAMVQGASRGSMFVGSMIGSFVAVVTLLFTDFGGWYNYNYYAGYREWGYVGISSPISLIGVFLFALPFIFIVFVSIKGVQNPDQLSPQTVNRAFIVSIIGVVLIAIAAVVFVIAVADSDDWWFDAGFYGSMGGGILSVIFLGMVKKTYSPTQGYAPGYGPVAQPQVAMYQAPVVQSPGQYQPYAQQQAYQHTPLQPAPVPQPAPAPGSKQFCQRCGAKVVTGHQFCGKCGAQLY